MPSTTGMVCNLVSGEVKGKIVQNNIGVVRAQSKDVLYKIAVVYIYRVKDQDYRGTRMAFPNSFEIKEKDPHKIGELWGIGREVSAAYDPADPGDSTLKKVSR